MKILNQFSNYQSYQKALENEAERLKEILKNKKEEQERLAMELLLKRQAEEQARLEKEKLERQKLEAEEAERKRLEAERLEKERIEREKLAISEEKEKALQNIIDWAIKNNIPEERLPRNIIDLSKIKELDLSNLKLRDLPNRFSQLEQLTNLKLSGNFILKYPDNLENLKNLYLLDLSNCGLDEVPEFVFKIEKLGHLDVSKNNLSYFFVDENEFNHLEHLDISSNKFEEDEIVKNVSIYQNIKNARIGENIYFLNIVRIENAINDFKKTKIKRNLQTKKFKEIFQKYQEYLSLIKKEKNEGIGYNEIKSSKVEKEFKKIYENFFENFFENFSFYCIQINSKLEKLKSLNLSNNNLFNFVPPKRDNYLSYDESQLDSRRKVTFQNILKLKSLEVLDIRNTNILIEYIPEIEKKFPFLRILKVSLNQKNIDSLKNLRRLEKIYVGKIKLNLGIYKIVNFIKNNKNNFIITIASLIGLLIAFWLFHSIAMNNLSNQLPPPPEPKGFFRKLFEWILVVISIIFFIAFAGRR